MGDSRLLTRLRAGLPAVVTGTVVLVVVHLLDDAAWHSPRGAAAGHGILLVLPLFVALGFWAIATLASPPPLQVALLFVAAALLLVDAALHLAHASDSGAGGSDVTGYLLGVAGIALLVVALAILARPKPARAAARRWVARLGVLVAAVALLLLVVTPLALAITAAHKPAMDVPQASLPPGHREVSFRSADGVRLRASYVAPRNGNVVLVLHGSGGDRGGGPLSRARILMKHGFGVLLLDARGSGDSSGRPENLGWTWPRDVRAAVDWLERQPGVRHVGGLGISTGAEAMLDAAARDPRIAAVVADGTQARQPSELRVLKSAGQKAFTWWELTVATNVYRGLTHAPQPGRLDQLIPRIAPRPVLLITASDSFERDMNRGYAKRAPGVELWEPADTGHTAGLRTHPREYERRVADFFDNAFAK